MPYRLHPIVEGEIYHVYNRSVGSQPIFLNRYDFKRALDVVKFYRYHKTPCRFSFFNRQTFAYQNNILLELEKFHLKQITLLSYCLMPNHIHFLIKEVIKSGISTFMRNFQNSYAKYFNTKNERHGALFQSMFKAVRVETDEQLIHVCRYIHLNPYSSYLLNNIEKLENYQWSSFPDYLRKELSGLVDTKFIMSYFSSIEKLKSFTYDQADYQRKLNEMKYFTIDDQEKL